MPLWSEWSVWIGHEVGGCPKGFVAVSAGCCWSSSRQDSSRYMQLVDFSRNTSGINPNHKAEQKIWTAVPHYCVWQSRQTVKVHAINQSCMTEASSFKVSVFHIRQQADTTKFSQPMWSIYARVFKSSVRVPYPTVFFAAVKLQSASVLWTSDCTNSIRRLKW